MQLPFTPERSQDVLKVERIDLGGGRQIFFQNALIIHLLPRGLLGRGRM